MLVAGKVHVGRRLGWCQHSAVFELNETPQCCGGRLDACNLFATTFTVVFLSVNLWWFCCCCCLGRGRSDGDKGNARDLLSGSGQGVGGVKNHTENERISWRAGWMQKKTLKRFFFHFFFAW